MDSPGDRLAAHSEDRHEIAAGDPTPLTEACTIDDYVLSTVVYDKTKSGRGRGDSERAWDTRDGNCTDFHSL